LTDDRGLDSLWQAARTGDDQAFEELITSLHPAVFRVALGMLGDYQEAEDVAQEAFLSAWRALPRLKPDTTFGAWLRRVTVNASIDHLRRRKRRRWWPWSSVAPTEGEADRRLSEVHKDDLTEEVHLALQRLPEHYRAVAVLREIDGLSYEEIAAVMSCSVGTVRSRLSRARERLKALLKKHDPNS